MLPDSKMKSIEEIYFDMNTRQCLCITKSGTRCKRTTQQGMLKCFQHAKTDPTKLRMLPSFDFSAESNKPILSIDLTLDQFAPRRMETRLSRRLTIEREIGPILYAIDYSRNDRRQSTSVIEERVKPRPPRRPRKAETSHDEASGKNSDCCICYDEKVSEERFLECGHALCIGCIKNLRNDKCPMCRVEINSKFISKTEKKRMQRRKRDDDEERNEEAYENYMRELVAETGNTSLLRNILNV